MPTQDSLPSIDPSDIRQRLCGELQEYVSNVIATTPEGDGASAMDRLIQRAAELATGSPDKPGVFCLVRSHQGKVYVTDESWVAWDYGPNGDKIVLTYTDLADVLSPVRNDDADNPPRPPTGFALWSYCVY